MIAQIFMQRIIMTFHVLFLFALLNTNSAISYEIKTVKYNISSSDDVICAASTTGDNYVGVRIQENSSFCEGLDINWRKDAEHLPGYKYVLKQAIILKYNPPLLLEEGGYYGNIIHLLIPGLLTPGSKIKLVFTKESQWDRLRIRILGNETHNENPSPNELVLYHMHISSTEFAFNQHSNGWGSPELFPRQFTDGVKQYVTIVVTQDHLQTFIEEEMVYNFTHVYDPSLARLLWIQAHQTTKAIINSLEINLEFPV